MPSLCPKLSHRRPPATLSCKHARGPTCHPAAQPGPAGVSTPYPSSPCLHPSRKRTGQNNNTNNATSHSHHMGGWTLVGPCMAPAAQGWTLPHSGNTGQLEDKALQSDAQSASRVVATPEVRGESVGDKAENKGPSVEGGDGRAAAGGIQPAGPWRRAALRLPPTQTGRQRRSPQTVSSIQRSQSILEVVGCSAAECPRARGRQGYT